MIVIDASVAVKWFIDERDSPAALAIFNTPDTLLAPSHAVGEIGEVLLRAYRRQLMSIDALRRANDTIETRLILRSPLGLVDRATTIAIDASVSFYDALYVAAGDLWSLDVVTADARLCAKLAPTRWGSRVRLLGT